MKVACLVVEISLPACFSLKDKRSCLKPLLAALHRKFNLSAAEVEGMDQLRSAVIACVCVSNDSVHNRRVLESALAEFAEFDRDIVVESHSIQDI